MRHAEVKRAANCLLRGRYPPPGYKIYGKEIREGYESPCFFTEIVDKGSRAETLNFAGGGFTVKITYFQRERDELDMLEKADGIKELFGAVFRVGERRLTVGEYSYDFIGEFQDILQVSVDFEYRENTRMEEAAETAAEVTVTVTQG